MEMGAAAATGAALGAGAALAPAAVPAAESVRFSERPHARTVNAHAHTATAVRRTMVSSRMGGDKRSILDPPPKGARTGTCCASLVGSAPSSHYRILFIVRHHPCFGELMTRTAASVALAAAMAGFMAPTTLQAQSFSVQKFDVGGEGFFDYLSVDTARNRIFISRGSHIQVVDGATGKAVGDIPNTPRTHGALIVNATNRGF